MPACAAGWRSPRFDLGAFGPGKVSPLHLQAQAELSEPALNAALELDAGLSLLPPPQAGASPVVRLDKTGLRLRGQGFELEGLDARLQAESIRLEYGAEQGLGDSHVEIDGAQLQFGGKRLGWQIDSGQLGLARLRLDILQRRLELDQLALQLKGQRLDTTLDAQLRWPKLEVQGDTLQGSALDGQLTLGGDQRLATEGAARSRPAAPSSASRVPGLQLDIDGQLGLERGQGPGRRHAGAAAQGAGGGAGRAVAAPAPRRPRPAAAAAVAGWPGAADAERRLWPGRRQHQRPARRRPHRRAARPGRGPSSTCRPASARST